MSETSRTTNIWGERHIVGNHNTQENYENSGSGTFIAKAEHVTVKNIGPSEEEELLRACMNELPLTDPRVDVTTIRANKERRLPGTCEWILNRPEYKSWSDGKGAQDLLLIGGPGIGKTMLSMFLVDTLKEKIQQSKQMLVYFFCDDKDARRRSDTAILRGLLYQLLDGELCKHMLAPYRRLGKSLFTQFDELAQIFSSVLESIPNGPVHILIDAMDECGATSLGRVMKLLGDLMTRKAKMKLLVTSRPHRTVEDCFKKCVQVDSERVKEDVDRYIKSKVKDLAKNERYSDDLKESVLSALQERSDGTFLWTSLILEHISDAASDEKAVLKTLQVLPRNLNGVYRRILSEIERKYSKEARFVFRLLVAARRPLTVDEVDVAYHLWTNKEAAYLSDHQIRKDIYKCCGSLVYLDREHRTVNFSHQSAKDYLMNADHQLASSIYFIFPLATIVWFALTTKKFGGLFYVSSTMLTAVTLIPYARSVSNIIEAFRSMLDPDFVGCRYRVLLDESNLQLFKICWQYLVLVLPSEKKSQPSDRADARKALDKNKQFQYAKEEWIEHALASSPASISQVFWASDDLERFPTLREEWLLASARQGHLRVLNLLLEKGANGRAESEDGLRAIDMAAENDHWDVVQVLQNKYPDLIPKKFQAVAGKGTVPPPDQWTDNNKVVSKWHQNFTEIRDDRILLGVTWGLRLVALALIWWMKCLPEQFLSSFKARSGPWILSFIFDLGLDHVGEESWSVFLVSQIGGLVVMAIPSLILLSFFQWWAHYFICRMRDQVRKDGIIRSALGFAQAVGRFALIETLVLALDEDIHRLAKILLWLPMKLDARDSDGDTPLLVAARRKSAVMVSYLLDKGADPNYTPSNGTPPICFAARKGYTEIVKVIIDTGRLNPNSTDFRGCTPMILAAWEGHHLIVGLLLNCEGFDVNRVDIDGDCALNSAAFKGRDKVVKILLNSGRADVNIRNKRAFTPLLSALDSAHESTTKILLGADNVDLSCRTDENRTMLSYAAANGYEDVVKILLQHSELDLNVRCSRGYTALAYAAKNGHTAIVEVLLRCAGIDVNVQNVWQETAFLLAAGRGHEAIVKLIAARPEADLDPKLGPGRNAMFYAAMSGHESVVKFLIDNTNVEVDRNKHFGKTPLASAANGGHAGVVKLLMETGKVDVNNRDRWDCTPFLRAAKGGHEEVVKLLMKVENLDLDPRTEVHRTPLSYAAEKGHESIVTLLLESKKVDVNSKSKELKQSPLFYAIKYEHERIADKLREAGATITEEEEREAEEADKEGGHRWSNDYE